jgi:hypothetical protein
MVMKTASGLKDGVSKAASAAKDGLTNGLSKIGVWANANKDVGNKGTGASEELVDDDSKIFKWGRRFGDCEKLRKKHKDEYV